MESEHGMRGIEGAAFARTLETLKRHGSNILLVGGDEECHDAVCHRLCGLRGSEPRYQLFVTDHDERHLTTRVVSRRLEDGSMTLTLSTGTGDRSSLEPLSLELVSAIDEFEGVAGGFAPSELRVCVDPLGRLLDVYDAQEVFRFLQTVTSRIDDARGMGHYHLPREHGHDTLSLLEPLFDAVVVLRVRDGSYEQQWHLRDGSPGAKTKTDWLRL
ncbi:DUF7504 family protein [Natronobacterium gregoryi]|uniref:Uncharacterized protein n=2 Tax=Natronobacterium gregoryi TaxID=44930 RepID=L0AN59_NATGS|nr:hypothetical protein [Natronobacterium gregoryi]AFZ74612.1 hypothetical protein Natgr_3493 [Natronobacterium gregoryi SP2]ELY72566.1 hypothetical protein C490_03218 [Natronobacterium gregoryi SP2]PLK19798.1 hypothetical protein CYV19_12885 [Natronobacterium gregoryi SP2]SFJ30477.1 hypothetical protein SAMN05443661_12130 [Natronobacterium gregoryi]